MFRNTIMIRIKKLFAKFKIPTKHKHLPQWARVCLIVIVVILLLENLVLILNNLQNKTTIVGLKLDNKILTGLSRAQIEEVIKQELQNNDQPLKLTLNDQTFIVKAAEIGAIVDSKQLTNQLLEKGRKGSILQKLLTQNQVLLGLKNEKLSGNISQTLLNLKLIEIQSEVNRDPKPLRPDFVNDLSKTLLAQDGLKVDTNKLTLLISDYIFSPPSSSILLPVIKTFTASHNQEELTPIRQQAQQAIKQSISIASGGLVFTLTANDLKNMLTVLERPDPKNPQKIILVLRLDDKKLNQKLGEFAQKVEAITGAEFNDHDGRVAIYTQFYSNKRRLLAIPTGRRLVNQAVLAETSSGPKTIYLTFDDGPNAIYHPMILDILKAYHVPATFFLVGQNVQRDLDNAKRTVGEGHKIGNHSLTHSFLPNLSSSSINKEIQTTDQILKSINGNQDIILFRPPYGGVNLTVRKKAEEAKLKLTLWDVDPRDWSEPPTDELVRRVVSSAHNQADILFHSNHLSTVKALPKIIQTLKGQGYTFEQLP